jgi:hypothetical protein
MKKLLGILVLGLLWCNILFAQDYMVIEREDDVRQIWNIKDAKEIGMMQFEVKYTRRPGKDLLIYNRKIVRELFNYCDKPVGKYESTPEMLYLGKPDRPDRGVTVKKGESSKSVEYWIPYYKFLNSWEIEKPYEWSDFDLTCKFKIKDTEEFQSREYMIDWKIKLENKEYYSNWYFDCDRLLYDEKEPWQGREIIWRSTKPDSNGEYYIKTACKLLGVNN